MPTRPIATRTRRTPIRTALAAVATALAAAPVSTNAADLTVPANRTTEIAFLNVYDAGQCASGGRPRIRLRQPEHGTITTRWTKRKITDNWFGLGGRKCVGRDMRGLAVYYTPDRGYRGTDDYSLRWTYRTHHGYRGFLGGETTTLRVR